MFDLQGYMISADMTVREALVALNKVSGEVQALFVTDGEGHMVGSLSDGDIRRGIIAGAGLEDKVDSVMHRDFSFLYEWDYDVAHLKALRERRILSVPILDSTKHIVDAVNLLDRKSQIPVDAILMAGGRGERLRPLTDTIPKPLLPVGDKTIIDHNVDRLISYGVRHINVTVNYLADMLEEHFSQPRGGVKVRTFREADFMGTIASVRLVEPLYSDTVLVMNSDVFTNIDFEDFYLHFCQNDAEMSVAAIPYNVSIPFGVLDLDGRNVKGILEKPKFNYYANAGIYLVRRRALDEIPQGTFFHATDLMEKLIAQGKKVIRYPLNGTWIDIGTPQEYQKAQDLIKHMK